MTLTPGLYQFRAVTSLVGVNGLYLAASSARFACELLVPGGDVATLGATDGGAGHERRDGEKMSLLAMVTRDSRHDPSRGVWANGENTTLSLLVMLTLS